MHANSMCIACIISKQEKAIRKFSDENKKFEYMQQVVKIVSECSRRESAPGLTEMMKQLYKDFWGEEEDFSTVKQKYNRLLLDKEKAVDERIRKMDDPVKECVKYVCAANYIDFSAVDNVNEKTFETLLEKAAGETVPGEEYALFCKDLKEAKTLVYLTDNCGEIVLDKLFIRYLQEAYPHLQITAIVRGREIINDATMKDAAEVGLTEVVSCIGNGSGAPGTILSRISEEARGLLTSADVIISKGQGNFESLLGEGLNPYYMFLCKCEMFVRRFGLTQYTSVFVREERLKK